MLYARRGLDIDHEVKTLLEDHCSGVGDLPDGTVVATDQPWLPLVIWRVTMTRPVLCIRERDEAVSLAGSEIELIWISREGLPGGAIGGGLRFRSTDPRTSRARFPCRPSTLF